MSEFKAACIYKQGQRNNQYGRECEDYAKVYQDNNYIIMAIADGATAASHARKAAEINVKTFINIFRQDYFWNIENSASLKKHLLNEINNKFKDTRWNIRDLSATLTGVAINKRNGDVIIISIGDGTVVLLDADHEAFRFVSPLNINGDLDKTYFTNQLELINSNEGNVVKMINLNMENNSVEALRRITGFTIFSDGGDTIFTKYFGKGAEFIKRIAEEVWINGDNSYMEKCAEDIAGNYTNDDISIATIVTDYATDIKITHNIVVHEETTADCAVETGEIDVDIPIEEKTPDDTMMSFEHYLVNEISKKSRTVEELAEAGIGDENRILKMVLPALKSGRIIYKNGKFCKSDK